MPQITFILNAQTDSQEQIYVCGSCSELGYTDDNAIPLSKTNEGWKLTVNIAKSNIRYSYFKKNGDKIDGEPWQCRRIVFPSQSYAKVAIVDTYGVVTKDDPLMRTKVFTEAVCYHEHAVHLTSADVPVIFNITMSSLLAEHEICLIGDLPCMGKWNEDNAVLMNAHDHPYWWNGLEHSRLKKGAEYKYIIRDKKTRSILSWEDGPNRKFKLPKGGYDMVIVSDGEPHFQLPAFKGTGIAVPVFSLRTKRSCGCGEFSDLKPLALFAKKCGMRIIQTLPINDTTTQKTWKDSYPYSGISTFALHPMYVNLEDVGPLPDVVEYKSLQDTLNQNETVDYEKVMRGKMNILRRQFAAQKEQTFQSNQYKQFFEANEYWLKPYAAFSYFRDIYCTCDTTQWGDAANYSKELVDKVSNESFKDYDRVAFYFFLQFHLDKQLRAAAAYCHTQGVALKGDIPIGVNANSVDVWQYPSLFDREGSAGAPPDDFSRTGQNWGFPIYNWKEMQKDDFAWWRARFRKMSDFFDAYRIDHILGFFRIFRIPKDYVGGLMGQFTPALPLSKEEIEAVGIPFDEEKLCEPDFSDEALRAIFGDEDMLVKETYMEIKDGKRRLREDVSTQVKIQNLLPYGTPAEKRIKDGLMEAMCNVLFVRDYQNPKLYHPRITLQTTLAYSMLSEDMKTRINKLYNNFYFERHNDFWREQAMQKLPALVNSTKMLCCGEDLGMVPACVPSVMQELNILSLEIQRMPKAMYVEFGDLSAIPYLSVNTTSTHDMSGIREWWEEDRARTRRYFNNELHEFGEPPMFCEPWLCERIIANHLASPAVWVILPLQDWLSMSGEIRWSQTFKERINNPADPDNYWKYRMHLNIEEMTENKDFVQKIKTMNTNAGR